MFEAFTEQLNHDPVESLTRRDLEWRLAEIRRIDGAIAAYRHRIVRTIDRLDDSGLDGAGALRTMGRMSSKTAARVARTADALTQMPSAADALARGTITTEHADAMADAAEKTEAPAAVDAELLASAEAAPADLFAKRSREWTAKHPTNDDLSRRERQRRNRSVSHWIDDDGMWKFLASLDPDTGRCVKRALDQRERKLWEDDGGRDGAPDLRRTHDQRLADAFTELIGQPDTAHTGTPHPRHQININIDIGDATTTDGQPLATLVTDGAPLPAEVLAHLSCNSILTPILFDGPGRPIWVGRDHRSATIAQWKALIARDRGCIGCGAAPDRCEAHHILEWEHFGPTNIDNLVLVCRRCHHDLHDRGMQLRRTSDRWHIVPRDGPAPLPRDHRDREIQHQLGLTA